MRPFHRDLYIILVITTIFQVVRMGGPYLFGKILDLLISSNGLLTWHTAFVIIAGLGGVRFLSMIVDYLTDVTIVRLLWKAERHVSNSTFSKLLELSMDYHEKENTGAKITLVNKGREKFIDLLVAYGFEFQPIVLQLVISCILISLTSWEIGLLFSLSLLPFIFITFKIYSSTSGLRAKRHDAYEISGSEIGDTITNITVVKAFAQETREQTSFQKLWNQIKDLNSQEFSRHMITGFGRSVITEIFYIILLIIGVYQIQHGSLTVGGLVFLISLVERSYSHVYRLGRIYERAIDAAEPVDRITALLHQKATVKNSDNPIIPQHLNGQIRFENVRFAYRKKTVLDDVNFNIPAGSFTALVGKSGSGKSTIAKLLSRYYDPVDGQIIIDNKYDLKQLDISAFRQQTAVVFQDSPVPSRRIWEVISYSAGHQSFAAVKDRVEQAAKLAHAHEFILELDNGYHTQIGERGVRLSGGQRQRLAIARALFAQPSILIMDEPTSHLDTLSESLIQQALEDISKQRAFTKIVIAHRLSTVQHADQILVMDKGRLVESGTHQQLLNKNGVYAQIVHQSELKG